MHGGFNLKRLNWLLSNCYSEWKVFFWWAPLILSSQHYLCQNAMNPLTFSTIPKASLEYTPKWASCKTISSQNRMVHRMVQDYQLPGTPGTTKIALVSANASGAGDTAGVIFVLGFVLSCWITCIGYRLGDPQEMTWTTWGAAAGSAAFSGLESSLGGSAAFSAGGFWWWFLCCLSRKDSMGRRTCWEINSVDPGFQHEAYVKAVPYQLYTNLQITLYMISFWGKGSITMDYGCRYCLFPFVDICGNPLLLSAARHNFDCEAQRGCVHGYCDTPQPFQLWS